MIMRKCPKCKIYTLEENCPKCKEKTLDANYKFIKIKSSVK
ncbi:MAG: nucleolar RNA-binding Nop10p family protein [Candidatus Pacearchaeota archaeon]